MLFSEGKKYFDEVFSMSSESEDPNCISEGSVNKPDDSLSFESVQEMS